ncbi:MAG TPA: HAMP domain-containing sensor histidine kinase [Phenylobacterium sp.]|uniref:sensor histidine kinase n=1 Tax=Phenylobacterium sp. TaxID=1871053 RepID=UPI002B465DD7|nr:HAMP domain-containing sensor histidine kinase [Phenylobacterium sp.]HKR88647.1 HAMP domain-containing sensor histidine kinase [Phenylobacterium sp.]
MADAPTPQELPKPSPRRFFWPGGLSARLLVLTVLFVALGGALTLPPSLADYERQWLLDRVRAAELASLAPEVAPDRVVSEQLKAQFLNGAGVDIVAVSVDGIRSLVFARPRPGPARAPYLVDLRGRAPGLGWVAPFRTLFGADGRRVRVMAEPRFRKADFVEFVASDAELKRALAAYLWRQFFIVAFVSTITGVLVYLALNLFLVRPMQRITRSMERFRADPEDPKARLKLSGRRDEIGRAEAELDRMQADLRAALHSRARLAALGEAVAKINHDLRNMLTSAQIASERLAALKDPKVSQALPRLERALDRAVRLASDVLAYGKTEEPAPEIRNVPLAPAVEAAGEEARLTGDGVRLVNEVAEGDQVAADPDQLHRILVNLLRNAREAIEHQEVRAGPGEVRVSLTQPDGVSLVRVADNGPGVPERVRERLFQAFAGSGRPGGAGLGLAIARELAQAHGGDLSLAESGPEGSTFELRLPGAPPRARRASSARSSA